MCGQSKDFYPKQSAITYFFPVMLRFAFLLTNVKNTLRNVALVWPHLFTTRGQTTLMIPEGALKKGYFCSPVVATFPETSRAGAALFSPSKGE